jgi:hypothetical protein
MLRFGTELSNSLLNNTTVSLPFSHVQDIQSFIHNCPKITGDDMLVLSLHREPKVFSSPPAPPAALAALTEYFANPVDPSKKKKK